MVRIIFGMQNDYTDKNPGLRVIKVREMLLLITAKMGVLFLWEDKTSSMGSLEVSAEKKMQVFKEHHIQRISSFKIKALKQHLDNAFNTKYQNPFIYNTVTVCSLMFTYVCNWMILTLDQWTVNFIGWSAWITFKYAK